MYSLEKASESIGVEHEAATVGGAHSAHDAGVGGQRRQRFFKFYDGLFTYTFYPPRSPQSGWNSFNAGEFLWPQSRWSLLPHCLICGGLSVWLLLEAGRVIRAAHKSEPVKACRAAFISVRVEIRSSAGS